MQILWLMNGGGRVVGDRVVNAALQLAIAALDGQVPSSSFFFITLEPRVE